MMEIKVLGPGCAKCNATMQLLERVIAENGIDAKLEKVEDIMQIMQYNVMATPAVLVDGELKIKGRVPSEKEIKEILGL